MSDERKCLLVYRIRGTVDVRRKVKDTLAMLRLHKPNHATLIDDRPSYLGMLQVVKDYVTWGEPTEETIAALLRRWGRTVGNKKLTDEYVKEKLGYESIEELARAIHRCEVEFWKLPGVKPVFRLHPPSGGFRRSTKRSYRDGGELGYRGEAINDLMKRIL